jgi:hypothetical protein
MHGDCDKRISTPRVGGSNPSGRAIFLWVYSDHIGAISFRAHGYSVLRIGAPGTSLGTSGPLRRLLEIGGETDRPVFGSCRHEQANRRKNSGNGLIVVSQLFIEPNFEFREAQRQLPVGVH